MGFCEGCGASLTVRYGSGRFCGVKCARSSATRGSREEINSKVSATLKGRSKAPRPPGSCPTCAVEFPRKKPGQRFCSVRCALTNPDRREKQSVNAIAQLQRGGNEVRGAIRCSFSFKGEKIRCDSKLEYACLDWFVRHHEVKKMERCSVVLLYSRGGRLRRYLPDFLIETSSGFFIVECKGDIYSRFAHEKWARYRESIEEKRLALWSYAADNNLTPMWFEKMTPGSRYRDRSLLGSTM